MEMASVLKSIESDLRFTVMMELTSIYTILYCNINMLRSMMGPNLIHPSQVLPFRDILAWLTNYLKVKCLSELATSSATAERDSIRSFEKRGSGSKKTKNLRFQGGTVSSLSYLFVLLSSQSLWLHSVSIH